MPDDLRRLLHPFDGPRPNERRRWEDATSELRMRVRRAMGGVDAPTLDRVTAEAEHHASRCCRELAELDDANAKHELSCGEPLPRFRDRARRLQIRVAWAQMAREVLRELHKGCGATSDEATDP